MKQYTFTYTKKELLEFCFRALWDTRRRRPAFIPAILLLSFAYALMLKRFPYEVFLLVAFLLSIELGILYFSRKKEGFLSECTIWTENGLLKCRRTSVYHETPCGEINRIIKGRRLLILIVLQKKNQPAWFLIPTRVFSCEKEKLDFLEELKRPVYAPADAEDEPEDFHFSFLMDINTWTGIEVEARFVFRSKDSHSSKIMLSLSIYYVLVCVLGISFLYWMGVGSIPAAVTMILFVGLLPLRRMVNPEKSVRKNILNSAAQNNLSGKWEMWFTSSGISYTVLRKRKVFMPWTEFEEIAETEHTFYLIRKNSRQFIPVPKICLESQELTAAWLQYCEDKGFVPVKIKKPVCIPSWLLTLLFVIIMCLFLASGIWTGHQRAKMRSSAAFTSEISLNQADIF